MEEVREMVGDKPVYISFDIDSLDPAYAPGTGMVTLIIIVVDIIKIKERRMELYFNLF